MAYSTQGGLHLLKVGFQRMPSNIEESMHVVVKIVNNKMSALAFLNEFDATEYMRLFQLGNDIMQQTAQKFEMELNEAETQVSRLLEYAAMKAAESEIDRTRNPTKERSH